MTVRRFSFLMMLILSSNTDALKAQDFPEAIEDNSFLIEEAYNQEPRVVQHITNTMYTMSPDHDFLFSFTQEWPVTTETHQLSYTFSYLSLTSNRYNGIGDLIINYRYQLLTKASWAALAPRLSLTLPTGDSNRGLGSGVFGLQVDLPASKRLTDRLVAHVNGGATVLPSVKGMTGAGVEVKQTLVSYSGGASVIWLAGRYDNFFVEALYNIQSSISGSGAVERNSAVVLNPAYRRAIEVGDLEVVPGLGIPFTFSNSSTTIGLFFYLSFEHPY